MAVEQLVVEVADDRADDRSVRRRLERVRVDEPLAARVVSGVSRSDGSEASTRPASRAALTSLPVAKPGWMSTPWTVNVTSTALNVSSCSSPGCEPSSV